MKTAKYILIIVALLGSLFSITAFQMQKFTPEEQKIVQQLFEEKVKAYKQKEQKDCQKRALERASKIVDSTLIANAKNRKLDDMVAPEKPQKPGKPEIKQIEDQSPVEPLLPID